MAYKNEWAEEVREGVADQPYRKVAPKVGVSASYIADWMQGKVPRRDLVVQWAKGLGRDLNKALIAAGYDPVEERNPDRLADQLLDLAEHQPEELTYDPDLEGVRVEFFEGTDHLSEKDRRILERVLRHARQRLLARQGLKVEGVEEE